MTLFNLIDSIPRNRNLSNYLPVHCLLYFLIFWHKRVLDRLNFFIDKLRKYASYPNFKPSFHFLLPTF